MKFLSLIILIIFAFTIFYAGNANAVNFLKMKRAGIALLISGLAVEIVVGFPLLGVGYVLAYSGLFITAFTGTETIMNIGLGLLYSGIITIGLFNLMWVAGIPLIIIGAIKVKQLGISIYKKSVNKYYTQLYGYKAHNYLGKEFVFSF